MKGLFVLCVCELQSGHVGVGCVSGKILCRFLLIVGICLTLVVRGSILRT